MPTCFLYSSKTAKSQYNITMLCSFERVNCAPILHAGCLTHLQKKHPAPCQNLEMGVGCCPYVVDAAILDEEN